MKFEFVDYYPFVLNNQHKSKNVIGTAHIYCVDFDMDIRGILVINTSKGIYFRMPSFTTYDPEQKKRVTYPLLGFVDQSKGKAIIDFLHQVVKPEIQKRAKKEQNEKTGDVPKKASASKTNRSGPPLPKK